MLQNNLNNYVGILHAYLIYKPLQGARGYEKSGKVMKNDVFQKGYEKS